MTAAVPFTLRVPGESRVEGPQVSSTTHRMHGIARLEGASMVLEWSGTTEEQIVGPASVRAKRTAIPIARAEVPVGRLAGFELRGWWRPRIELWASDLDTLARVPGVERGRLRLWLARRDRRAAAELVLGVQLEMAEEALRAADASGELPSPGLPPGEVPPRGLPPRELPPAGGR
jgi:hypothetical protein